MSLRVGEAIEIPCTFQPGAFSGERLVNIDTSHGPISGFVRVEDLRERDSSNGSVRAVVSAVDGEEVEVRIRGSFFTTNGIATIPSHKVLHMA